MPTVARRKGLRTGYIVESRVFLIVRRMRGDRMEMSSAEISLVFKLSGGNRVYSH